MDAPIVDYLTEVFPQVKRSTLIEASIKFKDNIDDVAIYIIQNVLPNMVPHPSHPNMNDEDFLDNGTASEDFMTLHDNGSPDVTERSSDFVNLPESHDDVIYGEQNKVSGEIYAEKSILATMEQEFQTRSFEDLWDERKDWELTIRRAHLSRLRYASMQFKDDVDAAAVHIIQNAPPYMVPHPSHPNTTDKDLLDHGLQQPSHDISYMSLHDNDSPGLITRSSYFFNLPESLDDVIYGEQNKVFGEIYSETSILATEEQEFQTPWDERKNFDFAIQLIERELTAIEYLRRLEQELPENAKLQNLALDRGHADALHGEMLGTFDRATKLNIFLEILDDEPPRQVSSRLPSSAVFFQSPFLAVDEQLQQDSSAEPYISGGEVALDDNWVVITDDNGVEATLPASPFHTVPFLH